MRYEMPRQNKFFSKMMAVIIEVDRSPDLVAFATNREFPRALWLVPLAGMGCKSKDKILKLATAALHRRASFNLVCPHRLCPLITRRPAQSVHPTALNTDLYTCKILAVTL
jgi:hypothetical protein